MRLAAPKLFSDACTSAVVSLRLRERHTHVIRQVMVTSKMKPPRTPPTIAPTGLLEEMASATPSADDDEEEGEEEGEEDGEDEPLPDDVPVDGGGKGGGLGSKCSENVDVMLVPLRTVTLKAAATATSMFGAFTRTSDSGSTAAPSTTRRPDVVANTRS